MSATSWRRSYWHRIPLPKIFRPFKHKILTTTTVISNIILYDRYHRCFSMLKCFKTKQTDEPKFDMKYFIGWSSRLTTVRVHIWKFAVVLQYFRNSFSSHTENKCVHLNGLWCTQQPQLRSIVSVCRNVGLYVIVDGCVWLKCAEIKNKFLIQKIEQHWSVRTQKYVRLHLFLQFLGKYLEVPPGLFFKIFVSVVWILTRVRININRTWYHEY